jgi:membrane protease YdiL (CAAX protease family)
MDYQHVQTHTKSTKALFAAAWLILGLSASLSLRIILGSPDAARSATAGLVFAICLVILSCAAGVHTKISVKIVLAGFVGCAVLIIPAFLANSSSLHPYGSYFGWSLVVGVVAMAEEVFFRGALFEMARKTSGEFTAVLLAAAAFALMHVPIYGWHVLPLDFSVGLFLGCLRIISGSWIAPGVAHTGADLAGWWLI